MPAEVVLMMDLLGVLTTSPFPAARRLAENMMRCVFERAGAHVIIQVASSRSVAFLARQYSNFFFTVIEFTERTRAIKGAFEKLELGEINRMEFIREFTQEIDFMLVALSKQNPEEMDRLNIPYPKRVEALRKRFPLLSDPIIQVHIRELLDVEAFLCTMEKVSPRKNVLNLLHYLRVKSQQEIRLFAMGNTWEFEGQYNRMVKVMSKSVTDSVSSAFPVTCPIDYAGKGGFSNSFQVSGLFDGYVQSYTQHQRKPYPDLFMQALEEQRESRMPTGEALRFDLKPNIFYFDDVEAHCEVARRLPGNPFTDVYLIEDGACDVYKDIVRALKVVAEKDLFWAKVVEGVEKDIGPLFKQPVDNHGRPTSWVNEELHNYNNNLLFIPPPPNDLCCPVNVQERDRYSLDDEDQEKILIYCAQNLPHLFPFDVAAKTDLKVNLRTQPGFATSAGPVTFEYVEGSQFFESYRITLRTGSYILRIQPRGPSPYGSTDIRHEYEAMAHFRDSSPDLCLPPPLLYCDSYAVCGRRFFLRRYRDGEIISSVGQLIQPRIRRPYSQRRVMVINVELQPKEFFREAIKTLCMLHNSTLPPFMKQQEEELRRNRVKVHPLLRKVQQSMEMYNLAISKNASKKLTGLQLRSVAIERLNKELVTCFDQTQLSHDIVPTPNRLVALHGNYNLSSLVFTHRSLEGRTKYPPRLIGVVQFRFTNLGDPLVDVAKLALFNYLPQPEGIFGAPREVQALFPSPSYLLEKYCRTRGYMLQVDRRSREDIFKVYMAAMCLQRATSLITDISVRENTAERSYSDSRSVAMSDQMAQRGLDILHSRRMSSL